MIPDSDLFLQRKIVFLLVLLCPLPYIVDSGYLLDGSGAECWVTDLTASIHIQTYLSTGCPSTISLTWVNAGPSQMFVGSSYPVQYKLSTTLVTFPDSTGYQLRHANLHSCLTYLGACVPSITVSPGLVTQTKVQQKNLTLDSSGSKSGTVTTNLTLTQGEWTVLAHVRLVSPTIQYDIAIASFKEAVSPPPPAPSQSTDIATVIGMSVGGIFLLVLVISLVIYLFIYRKHYSNKARMKKERLAVLAGLPLHRLLLHGSESIGVPAQIPCKYMEDDIRELIKTKMETVCVQDFDGHNVFDIIFSGLSVVTITDRVVYDLLVHHLPIAEMRGDLNCRAWNDCCKIWCDAVQQDSDAVVEAVTHVLRDYRIHAESLSVVTDTLGRVCKDIASQRCKTAIHNALCLHGRYSIKEGPPEHISTNGVVVIAMDSHGEVPTASRPGDRVVLKFIRNRDHFLNEVNVRLRGGFDALYVMPLITAYDGDASGVDDKRFREDAISKGYGEYPYCIVMEAAEQSLKSIIDHERISSSNMHKTKQIFRELTMCVEHIHTKKFIHGDIKPLCILRAQGTMKLTDLVAAVSFDEGGLVSGKHSSAYIPPERLQIEDGYPEVIEIEAHPSQDLWALGCVLYVLCTGCTLFLSDVEDNLHYDDDFLSLMLWTDDFKASRLEGVTDKLARNLISLLLMYNPEKRLSATRVLNHPFLTDRPSPRLQGEAATWDVFLSYRKESDSQHAEDIYNRLEGTGMKIWWDKKCLPPGQNWEEGFCAGLVSSAFFVCLLSKEAIKCPARDRHNFEKLAVDSPCDNVLLEWRLAQELKERGMIQGIFPVMIGDKDPTRQEFSSYFRSGCNPAAPALTVRSVETKLREHLNRVGLGLPYTDELTVKDLLAAVTSNQGCYIRGDYQQSLEDVTTSVLAMKALTKAADPPRSAPLTPGRMAEMAMLMTVRDLEEKLAKAEREKAGLRSFILRSKSTNRSIELTDSDDNRFFIF